MGDGSAVAGSEGSVVKSEAACSHGEHHEDKQTGEGPGACSNTSHRKGLGFFLPTCALNFEDSLPSELQMFFSEETSTGGVGVAVLENEATSEKSPLMPMGCDGGCARGPNFTGPACP